MIRYDKLAEKIFGSHEILVFNRPRFNNDPLVKEVFDNTLEKLSEKGALYRLAGEFFMEEKDRKEYADYLESHLEKILAAMREEIFSYLKENEISEEEFYDAENMDKDEDGLYANDLLCDLAEDMDYPHFVLASLIASGNDPEEVQELFKKHLPSLSGNIFAVVYRHFRHPSCGRRIKQLMGMQYAMQGEDIEELEKSFCKGESADPEAFLRNLSKAVEEMDGAKSEALMLLRYSPEPRGADKVDPAILKRYHEAMSDLKNSVL